MKKNKVYGVVAACALLLTIAIPQGAQAKDKTVTTYEEMHQQSLQNYQSKKMAVQSTKSFAMEDIHNRQVIIQLTEGSEWEGKYPIERIVDGMSDSKWLVVRIPEDASYQQELQSIASLPYVQTAHPDYLLSTFGKPLDEYYVYQNYMKDINMEKAWNITKGSSSVKVAVLDSGANVSHEDFNGRFHYPFNAMNGGSNIRDEVGHGTFVSGIIGANDNTKGITGVAPNVSLIPVKVGDDYGIAMSDAAEGVYHAMEKGADVVNMSFGSTYEDTALASALLSAYEEGILLVAATGNDSTSRPMYPSAYPWVMAVGATDTTQYGNAMAYFSNYGPHVDIGAPGVDIFSTSPGSSYSFGDGTSFSAPMVSGVAALIKSKHRHWNADQVQYALQTSADKWNSSLEWNEDSGFGQLDGYDALKASMSYYEKDKSNSIRSATVLKESDKVEEGFNFPRDSDLYSFDMKYDGSIQAEMSNLPQHIDGELSLYKEAGNGYTLVREADRYTEGGSEEIATSLKAGNYIMLTSDYYSNWSKQPYTLTMERHYDNEPNRLKGNSRYETAVEISKAGWSNGADTIVLAKASDFPDALAGAPLAYAVDGPILLSKSARLDEATKEEIIRLRPKKAYLLGGKNALQPAIQKELNNLGVETVTRIAGTNRNATAKAIADELKAVTNSQTFQKAIVVYNKNFPDALSAAAYAAKNGYPILLSDKDSLPIETASALEDVKQSIIVGGDGVVSDKVKRKLPDPARYAGTNRYDTNFVFNEKAGVHTNSALVTTGENFADALTGSVLAAKQDKLMILVKPDKVPDEIKQLVQQHSIHHFDILGGPNAVNRHIGVELQAY
ncbi:S8 family serine peptidase [Pontibacillus salicampi]|uniref:S8 family serine peptidase n=1 Tax=Pontibacillus salicampi TaxID=1449801 RepID=A0ABV6LS90_9BACI